MTSHDHGSTAQRVVWPDQRDGSIYVISDETRLAVDIALATGRPLLLRGEPGSGKSSLAPFVARERSWRYYEHVVTARTQATDLLWSFDAVRRLGDAQAQRYASDDSDYRYVNPGAFWWAIAPGSAARRGAPESADFAAWQAVDPSSDENRDRSINRAVVLIDEIDKADPDVPNSLLVPLGSSQFVVAETGTLVRPEISNAQGSSSHLVIITTNEERELPQAFLRRCVIATLPEPTEGWLREVAARHVLGAGQPLTPSTVDLIAAIASAVMVARAHAEKIAIRPPSTAEFLDALRACLELDISTTSKEWHYLQHFILSKPQQQM